jgi:hypothetical protein
MSVRRLERRLRRRNRGGPSLLDTHGGGHRYRGPGESQPGKLERALKIDVENWKREVLLQDALLYGDPPKELLLQRELLISRL